MGEISLLIPKSSVMFVFQLCTFQKGTIMHELMHATGFYHEQARFDRNNSINVAWKNVQEGKQDQFKLENRSKTKLLGTEYDYDSVMHYDDEAFTIKRGL